MPTDVQARNRERRRHPDELDPDLILVPEAARRLGLHVDTLYRMCREGRFPPAVKLGSRWLVSVPKLTHYLHGTAS